MNRPRFFSDSAIIMIIYVTISCHLKSSAHLALLDGSSEKEPEFISPIPNITVQVGRDAQLACLISNLGSFKAAWLRVEDKGILTIHEHIITRNYRISLTTNDNRNFILNIKNVQDSDKGGYMCQINTVPMKSQVGYLDVVYPPQMIADNPSDYVFNEGSNASLVCKARGYPSPTIHWKREDRKEIPLHSSQGKKLVVHNITGEVLNIARVTRVHMGAYLCIASNGVPNSVSRRFLLQVRFAPVVWISKKHFGASIGRDLTLSCHIDSFPPSVNYWVKKDGDVIEESQKYRLITEEKDLYKTQFTLVIKNVDKNDLTSYSCLAKNPLGSKETVLTVIESPDHHGGSSYSRERPRFQLSERSPQQDISSHIDADNSMDNNVYVQGEGLRFNFANRTKDIFKLISITSSFFFYIFCLNSMVIM